jgi:hypothetical protein
MVSVGVCYAEISIYHSLTIIRIHLIPRHHHYRNVIIWPLIMQSSRM